MNSIIDSLPLDEQKFEICRSALKHRIETKRQRPEEAMNAYLAGLKFGLRSNQLECEYQQLDKLTLGDLAAFAKDNISEKPFTICIGGSEAKIDLKRLEKFGEVKKISPEELFGYWKK